MIQASIFLAVTACKTAKYCLLYMYRKFYRYHGVLFTNVIMRQKITVSVKKKKKTYVHLCMLFLK